MGSLSNAPLISSNRGGLKLEVLAQTAALGSSKNVPLCKHTVTSLPLYQPGDLKPLISCKEQESLGISAWIWSEEGMILLNQYYFSDIWCEL